MKKITATLWVLGLACTVAVGSVWAAESGVGGPGNQLVSQEQRAQFQEVCGRFMNQTQDIRRQIATKVEQLKTLYAQPVPDREQIAALQNEIIDLRAAMAKQAVALQATLNDDIYGMAGGMCMRMLHDRGMYGMHGGGHGPRMMGPGPAMGPGSYGRHCEK